MYFLTLREICDVTKVSRRAIQGYEKMNLVCATCKNERGYNLYDEKAKNKIIEIRRLQNMGFSLKEIVEFSNRSAYSKKNILYERIALLKQESRRIEEMIEVANEMIERL